MSDFLTDVFSSDAFSVQTLTAAVNKMPHVPGQAGALGIFEEQGVPTTSIVIEEESGVVSLIPNTTRGAPANKVGSSTRKARTIAIPHFPTRTRIMADEVRNLRAFGQASSLKTVEQARDNKMANHMASLDATLEYGRIGALKGVIKDANGSTTILDLFAEYGLTQDTTSFALGTAETKIRTKCMVVKRKMEAALGAATYEGIVAFCSSTFFDALVDHANVVASYQNWQAAEDLRKDKRRGFTYGDITFIEYRGSVTGSAGSAVDFIAADKAYAFPVGVPGLFITRFAPADYVETVGTIGLPRYAKAEMMKFNKGIDIEMQTNPISLCTRPQVLQEMTIS